MPSDPYHDPLSPSNDNSHDHSHPRTPGDPVLPSHIPHDEDSEWILLPAADLLEAELPGFPAITASAEGHSNGNGATGGSDSVAFQLLKRWTALEGNRVLYHKWMEHVFRLYLSKPSSHHQYTLTTSLITQGLAFVRQETRRVQEGLKTVGRGDLETLVGGLEGWETDRLKAMARLQVVKSQSTTGAVDLSDECHQIEKRLEDLAGLIAERSEDIRAEMADLSASA